jgi:hypothetical protein
MIIYLVEIFKNLFKAQDTYINFYKIIIKKDESFSDFYTWFLRLIGIGKIPINDL